MSRGGQASDQQSTIILRCITRSRVCQWTIAQNWSHWPESHRIRSTGQQRYPHCVTYLDPVHIYLYCKNRAPRLLCARFPSSHPNRSYQTPLEPARCPRGITSAFTDSTGHHPDDTDPTLIRASHPCCPGTIASFCPAIDDSRHVYLTTAHLHAINQTML